MINVDTRECSPEQRQRLENQARVILDRIAHGGPEQNIVNNVTCLPIVEEMFRQDQIPRRLRSRIIGLLQGGSWLEVDCRPEARCQYLRGQYLPSEREIEMCHLREGEPALLFHELVHASGGTEFDAEVYENLVFAPQEGATTPTSADIQKFQERNHSGEFARLDTEEMAIYNPRGEQLPVDASDFIRDRGLI